MSRLELSTAVLIALSSGCTALPQRDVRFAYHSTASDREFDPDKKRQTAALFDDTITSFSTPSDLRLGFVRGKDSLHKYCAEPMPDVAMSSEVSGSGSLALSAAMNESAAMNVELARENAALREELSKKSASSETGSRNSEDSGKSNTTNKSSSGVGASSTMGASGSLDAAITYRSAVTAAELAGRTQQVLLAREFMYRLCEAGSNKFLEGSDYGALLEKGLAMVENVATGKSTGPADLLKQVNEYNEQRRKICDIKLARCDRFKDKPRDECLAAADKCFDELKLLEHAAVAPKVVSGQAGSSAPATTTVTTGGSAPVAPATTVPATTTAAAPPAAGNVAAGPVAPASPKAPTQPTPSKAPAAPVAPTPPKQPKAK